MQQVTARVFAETRLQGGNPGFVVTREGVVLIDTPVEPEEAGRWREEVQKRGPVRYLINTEAHLDHVLGNYFFDAPVISSQGVREALLSASLSAFRERVKQIYQRPVFLPENYQLRMPTLTFTGQLTLYLGELTFQLLPLPGHTRGEVGVYIPEEKVVFPGDTIFCRVQTFLHEAEPALWLESLKKLKSLDVAFIVPGHGEVCDQSYIEEQAAFILEWVEAVREARVKGWDKEEAKKRISFLDRYPMDWGLKAMGPQLQERNVERLYTWLSENPTMSLSW